MRKFTWKPFYKPIITTMLLLASAGIHAQYCTPVSTSGCSDDDDINSFVLTGENSTAISDLNTGCSANAYQNRTALPAVALAQGSTYVANISSEYEGDFAAIWIDFNDNNDFESTELAGFRDESIATTLTGFDLTIPATAPLGNHRMRVTVYYPGFSGAISSSNVDPCNTGAIPYAYGETQDYTINVISPAACIAPSNLSATGAANGATLSWAGTGNYIVEYGPAGFTPGTGATAGGGTIVAPASSPQTI